MSHLPPWSPTRVPIDAQISAASQAQRAGEMGAPAAAPARWLRGGLPPAEAGRQRAHWPWYLGTGRPWGRASTNSWGREGYPAPAARPPAPYRRTGPHLAGGQGGGGRRQAGAGSGRAWGGCRSTAPGPHAPAGRSQKVAWLPTLPPRAPGSSGSGWGVAVSSAAPETMKQAQGRLAASRRVPSPAPAPALATAGSRGASVGGLCSGRVGAAAGGGCGAGQHDTRTRMQSDSRSWGALGSLQVGWPAIVC